MSEQRAEKPTFAATRPQGGPRRLRIARGWMKLPAPPRRSSVPQHRHNNRDTAGVLDVHAIQERRAASVIDADGGKHEDEEYAGAEEQRRTAQVAPFRAQIGILALVARA